MVAKYKIVFISVLHHHKKDAVKDNYCIEKFAGAIYNLVKTFITTSDSNDGHDFERSKRQWNWTLSGLKQ